ncbi:hypothetical protein AeRB84_016215 [Aphanomyces euteiches]|nr:hypothetical protein AeRB84_016215 [Aphanomyces euteiches]
MTLLRAEPKAHEEADPYDSDSSPIGDFAPASTMRLMPVEFIANFDGDRDNRNAAASWLQRFEETAIACGWSDLEILRRFRLHSDKPVHDWLLQVNPEFLSSWAKLRARFVKEYVKSPIPKTEVYYSMTQGPGEHLKAYFVRFNAAALRIKLDYRRNRENLAAHIDRFARTLTNRMLAQAINLQQFRTIDDLEDYLDKQQQQEAIDRFQARAKSAQSAPRHTHIPVSDRAKTRKPTVQFMDAAESVGASWDDLQAEIFALGRSYSSAKRVQCHECGREHFTIDGQCCPGVPRNPDRFGHNARKSSPEKEKNKKTQEKASAFTPPAIRAPVDTYQEPFQQQPTFTKLAPVDNKQPVIWNISQDSNTVSPTIHYTTKDHTITPWEFDLKDGEQLGFLSEPKLGEEGNHQALLSAKLMDRDAIVLADTGADMSVVHLRAVEWLNLPIDRGKSTKINGLGSNSIRTLGTVPVKLVIGNGIAYYLELDVCDLGNVGFNAVLDMDFLSRACMAIDTECREISLPDGERVALLYQPTRYHRGDVQYLETSKQTWIAPGESTVINIRRTLAADPQECEHWVHRGTRWITTFVSGVDSNPVAVRITNVSAYSISLLPRTIIGAITDQ